MSHLRPGVIPQPKKGLSCAAEALLAFSGTENSEVSLKQSSDLNRLTYGDGLWIRVTTPRELERKIEQAARIVSRLNDQMTVERLSAWIEDLKLRQRLEARRTKQAISARAHELWEQNGRPAARDLEFWLQAESEIRGRDQE